jgi:medium-chain acyl-[acyl-carrier-protein] hydrolase
MTLVPPSSAWVKVTRPRPAARLSLVCLPFAGGGAGRFRQWPAYLPDDVEVVPIQLPGREDRFLEPAIDSMDPLASRLLEELAGYLDRPFVLFGHSMGALIAFELARRLRSMGLEPVRLLAAGCRAPHLPRNRPDRHALPDQEFVAAVRDLNGIPAELLENADFMDLVLPTLRSDFKLVEGYVYRDQTPLSCPLSVFGGLQDNEVTHDDLAAWSRHTTGAFQVNMLPGDHFFLDSARTTLLRLVRMGLDGSGLDGGTSGGHYPGHQPGSRLARGTG